MIEENLLAEHPNTVLCKGHELDAGRGTGRSEASYAGSTCGGWASLVQLADAGEEINRVLVDQASDLLVGPTETAAKNHRREGIPDDRMHSWAT